MDCVHVDNVCLYVFRSRSYVSLTRCDVREEFIMTFMEELLEDSLESSIRYRGDSPIKSVSMDIASMGQKIHAEFNSDVKVVTEELGVMLLDMSSRLRKTTGMDITLRIDPDDFNRKGYGIHVELPKKGDTPSVIYGRLSDKVMESLMAGDIEDTVLGKLDYNKRTVSGYFSTIPFTVNLGIRLFDPELLEVSELAAVLLHEVGHVWDFLDVMGDLSRGSAVASYTRNVLNGNYTVEKKLSVIKILDPKLGSAITDPSEVKDVELNTLVTANTFARKPVEYKTWLYDRIANEYVADGFATQNGLGYQLAKAMGKLEREKFFLFRDSSYKPIWTGVFLIIPSFIHGWSLAGYVVGNSTINPLLFTLGTSLFKSFMPAGMRARPQDRLEKIRQGMIRALRDPDTSTRDKNIITEDLKALDKEYKTLNPDMVHGVDYLFTIISELITAPSKRYVKERLTLDSLDNNRLFEMTERLRQLTK